MPVEAVLLNLSYEGPRPASLASGCLNAWASADPQIAAAISISFCDAFIHENPSDIAAQVANRRPRLVGFSCYVWNIEHSLKTAKELKKLLPDCAVVLGGPEAGGLAAEILADHPEIDFISIAEGEETFRLLLKALFLEDGTISSVPGLGFRDSGMVRVTPEPPLIDLAQAPSPYLENRIELSTDAAFAILETARGCPFTCSFCDWGPRKMRTFDLSRFEAELALVTRRWNFIGTNDSDVLMERTRAKNLLNAFLRASASATAVLGVETNPVHLWPEIVELVSAVPNRFYFAFGLQSISPAVNKLIQRPFNIEKIEARLAEFTQACPATPFHFSLIFGLPGDTLEGFRRSITWSLQWRPTRVALNQCLALPGSHLHRNHKEFGIVFEKTAPHRVLSTPTMSPKDFMAARRISSLISFIFRIRPLREALLERAVHSGQPLEFFERWMSFVEKAGVRLETKIPFENLLDRFPWEAGEHNASFFLHDPLQTAVLLGTTRRFLTEETGKAPPSLRTKPSSHAKRRPE